MIAQESGLGYREVVRFLKVMFISCHAGKRKKAGGADENTLVKLHR
jgi:hypothetical protein